ncbi:MAG TPA: exopolysaccharide biosynthesis polyprenyl glycosylphosphotransferase, partial [Sphingomicrobium sp.]
LRDHVTGRAPANDCAEHEGASPKPAAAMSPFRSSKAALRVRLYTALMVFDALALIGAFLAANLLRFGTAFDPSGTDVLVILLPFYLIIAWNRRAYAMDVLTAPKLGLKRSLQSFALALAIVIGAFFYMKASAEFSRLAMAFGTIGAAAALTVGRVSLGQYVGAKYKWRFTNEVIFADETLVYPDRGQIVLFADAAGVTPTTLDPAALDRMGRLLQNCDRVILACPPERRATWSAMMKGIDIDVEVMAPELDEIGALGMGAVGGRPTLVVSRGALALRDRILKRTFDLCVSVPLILLGAPIFLAVAIAIKLDSPGPVFFRQPRVGLGNRQFQVLKFRSMRVDMLDTNASKLTQVADPRVTRIGDFLRRTSLDEIPQLLNVVRGEMSIVGPRPHATGALAGDELYWLVDSRYWDRHAAKPGITGLAQVRGFRGTTFEKSDLIDRLQADLEYLTGWSLWRDTAILFSTAKVLLHKNAF